MATLLAYHNDPAIKVKYLARVEAHRKADEIIQGQYWEGGRGCAVGCTIHGSDHAQYEVELGIPQRIAYLEDVIFEGLPIDEARDWPRRFLTAIRPGTNLLHVHSRFCLWLMTEEIPRNFDATKWPQVASAVAMVADLHRRTASGESVSNDEWSASESTAAWLAAWSAAQSVELAAQSAAWSAELAAQSAYKRMADHLVGILEAE